MPSFCPGVAPRVTLDEKPKMTWLIAEKMRILFSFSLWLALLPVCTVLCPMKVCFCLCELMLGRMKDFLFIFGRSTRFCFVFAASGRFTLCVNPLLFESIERLCDVVETLAAMRQECWRLVFDCGQYNMESMIVRWCGTGVMVLLWLGQTLVLLATMRYLVFLCLLMVYINLLPWCLMCYVVLIRCVLDPMCRKMWQAIWQFVFEVMLILEGGKGTVNCLLHFALTLSIEKWQNFMVIFVSIENTWAKRCESGRRQMDFLMILAVILLNCASVAVDWNALHGIRIGEASHPGPFSVLDDVLMSLMSPQEEVLNSCNFIPLWNFQHGNDSYNNTCFIAVVINLRGLVPAVTQRLALHNLTWKQTILKIREEWNQKYAYTQQHRGQDDAAELLGDLMWEDPACKWVCTRTTIFHKCKHSTKTQLHLPMLVLSLPEEKGSVHVSHLMQKYLEPEFLSDLRHEDGFCDMGNQEGEARLSFDGVQPDICILRIKRYTHRLERREDHVFPDSRLDVCGTVYSLRAILEHKGRSANSGHYIMYLRNQQGWEKRDDACCTAVGTVDGMNEIE